MPRLASLAWLVILLSYSCGTCIENGWRSAHIVGSARVLRWSPMDSPPRHYALKWPRASRMDGFRLKKENSHSVLCHSKSFTYLSFTWVFPWPLLALFGVWKPLSLLNSSLIFDYICLCRRLLSSVGSASDHRAFFLLLPFSFFPSPSLSPSVTHPYPSDPSRKVAENHPPAWSRLMAKNALLKDSTALSTVFSPGSSTQAFFGIAKSSPWDERGQEVIEDEVCTLNKDATTSSCWVETLLPVDDVSCGLNHCLLVLLRLRCFDFPLYFYFLFEMSRAGPIVEEVPSSDDEFFDSEPKKDNEPGPLCPRPDPLVPLSHLYFISMKSLSSFPQFLV